jgi:benzoyl-CoA reductase/2-hydroxyglutaryl-CoA dehydratase subunit BcrC/BadD/HgdB
MAPEIVLAVAQLDIKGVGYNDAPSTTSLREWWPELEFFFDKFDDLAEEYSEEEQSHQDTAKELEELRTRDNELQELMAKVCKLSKDSTNATEQTLRVVLTRIHTWAEAGCDINEP